MHFGDCWHTANAWLHVGNASIGYGSFSVLFFPPKIQSKKKRKEKKCSNAYFSLCSLNHKTLCFWMDFFFIDSIPFFRTIPHGWSNRKSWKLLHSGSRPGSLHKHVGRKNGNACNVFKAAKHFVTVTVLHATKIKKQKIDSFFYEFVIIILR